MPTLPPYRYHQGEIPETLSRWLELARQCILQGGGNVDTGSIGDSLYLVRSVDLDRDTLDVAADDPDFNLNPLPIDTAWALEGSLKFTGAGGIRFNISGPIDGDFHWDVTDPGTDVTTENNNGMLDDVLVPVISGNMAVAIKGVFRSGSNPVPFNMAWAQETSNASALTLQQGSWLRLTRLTDVTINPPAPVPITT